MRPKSVNVTSSNTPYVIPVDRFLGKTSLQANANGTVNYTVSYTLDNIFNISNPATNAHWTDVTDMAAATADIAKVIDGPVTALKVVHNSGAGSVDLKIVQSE